MPGVAATSFVAATPVAGNRRSLPRSSRGNEAHIKLVKIREIRVKTVSGFRFQVSGFDFALCVWRFRRPGGQHYENFILCHEMSRIVTNCHELSSDLISGLCENAGLLGWRPPSPPLAGP